MRYLPRSPSKHVMSPVPTSSVGGGSLVQRSGWPSLDCSTHASRSLIFKYTSEPSSDRSLFGGRKRWDTQNAFNSPARTQAHDSSRSQSKRPKVNRNRTRIRHFPRCPAIQSGVGIEKGCYSKETIKWQTVLIKEPPSTTNKVVRGIFLQNMTSSCCCCCCISPFFSSLFHASVFV